MTATNPTLSCRYAQCCTAAIFVLAALIAAPVVQSQEELPRVDDISLLLMSSAPGDFSL